MTDPLFDSSGPETRVLEEARRGFSPRPADLERVFGGLARVFAIPDGLHAEPPSPPAEVAPLGSDAASLLPKSTAGPFSMKALVVSSGLSLALGFGAGFGVSRVIETSEARVAAPAQLDSPREAPIRAEPTSRVEMPSPDAPENVEPVAPAAPRRPVSQKSSRASVQAAKLTPYDELNTVRNAQSALKAGDALRALGLVQELSARTRGGALLAERGVIEVLALCQLERADEARRLAESFLKRTPDFVYAQRLRSSCALGPEISPSRVTRDRE